MKTPAPSGLRTTLAALTGLCLAGSAPAAIVVSTLTNVAPSGPAAGTVHDPSVAGSNLFAASATDLVNGLLPAVTYVGPGGAGNVNFEGSAGPSAWNNGSISTIYKTADNAVSHAAYGVVGATTGATDRDVLVTYDLGNVFNVARISVFTGWNDSGRDDSSFNVLVSTDNINFTQIAAYVKGPDNTGAINTPVTNFHSILDDGGADIASGVRYVQIRFTDADNGAAGVSEIDVFGQAVPETSTAALGLVGGLLLLRRRRA